MVAFGPALVALVAMFAVLLLTASSAALDLPVLVRGVGRRRRSRRPTR